MHALSTGYTRTHAAAHAQRRTVRARAAAGAPIPRRRQRRQQAVVQQRRPHPVAHDGIHLVHWQRHRLGAAVDDGDAGLQSVGLHNARRQLGGAAGGVDGVDVRRARLVWVGFVGFNLVSLVWFNLKQLQGDAALPCEPGYQAAHGAPAAAVPPC